MREQGSDVRDVPRSAEERDAAPRPLEAEELEPVVAPGIRMANHNETFLAAAVLETEEPEPVVTPGIKLWNHNETFLAAAGLETEENPSRQYWERFGRCPKCMV